MNMRLPFFLLVIYFISSYSVCAEYPAKQENFQPAWYFDYDVKFYKIDLSVNDTNTIISGSTTIQSEIKIDKLDTFKFELSSRLSIDSTIFDSHKVKFVRKNDVVSVILPNSYSRGQILSISIYYNGDVSSYGFFSPLSNQKDNYWNISITWTLSEPLGAKFWFPCKQYLPDKADSAWIFLTVPNKCKAGSNGILTKTVPVGNGRTRYEWKTKYPIAYYLISFSVAEYQDYSFYVKPNGNDSILVQNYIYNRPNYLSTFKSNIDKTNDFLVFYSRIFGMYPFQKEKYGHCLAPLGGGMEHQTMTTLSGFDNSLVSHELAHQWFGDMVTCATWQDIWVNEGFASYCEYLCLDELESHGAAQSWMVSAHQSALQEPSGAVYVPIEDSENDSRIFSYSLSYKKGASILHTLRYEINNDILFFKALKQYLITYKDSVATALDFIGIVNQVTGSNYNWFLDQWYFGKGFPIFELTWKQVGNQLTVISNQKTSDTATAFFKAHFDLKLVFDKGDTIIRLPQEKQIENYLLTISKPVKRIILDPNEWLLKSYKIENLSSIQSFDDYLEVLPNPFSDEVNLTFKKAAEGDRIVKLITMNGDTVFEHNFQKESQVKLVTTGILPANYILCVIEGSRKSTRKIIKIN